MKQIFENEQDANKRAALIEDNCYTKKKAEVKRYYSPGELQIIMAEFCHVIELMESKEDELRDVSDPIKEEIKKYKKDSRVGIEKLKRKYEVVETDLFGFDNQEQGIMEFYDINGVFVSSDRLTPDQRQFKLKAASNE